MEVILSIGYVNVIFQNVFYECFKQLAVLGYLSYIQ